MEKATQEEHEKANREWKEKIESFNGTPEDFERSDFLHIKHENVLLLTLHKKSMEDGQECFTIVCRWLR